MIIGLICTEDPRDVSSWSGIPYFVYHELIAQVSNVVLVSPLRRDFRYLYAPIKLLGKLLNRQFQVDRHDFALKSYARQIARMSSKEDISVYIVLSSIPTSRLGGKVPVVQWTDAVFECMPGYYSGAFSHLSPTEAHIAHAQEQSALSRSAYAVYSSEWAASVVSDNYRTRVDQIRVIPFGSNIANPPSTQAVDTLIAERLRRNCVLLFVGVDWNRKGGQLALEATEILNQRGISTTLTVVGCGSPASPFVRNLGFLNKNKPADLQVLKQQFSEATFFVFPTRAEAAGIVLCEAASYGLPIISSITGGVPTYVHDSRTGVLLSLSATAKDYADAIERLLIAPEIYTRLSRGARMLYEDKLNWRVAVKELLALCYGASGNVLTGASCVSLPSDDGRA